MTFCTVEYFDPSTDDLSRRGRTPGGDIVVTDPTTKAGSVAVGAASYQPPANSIYMDINGSDSNPGTLAAPKKSLLACVNALSSGATVVVRGGTAGAIKSYNDGWNTQTSTTRQPTILSPKSYSIQNYPGEAAWFDGSVAFTGAWTTVGSTWSHSYTMRFDRSHTFASGADDVDTGTAASGAQYVLDSLNPIAANPDQIFFDGVALTPVATQAQVGPGKFWVQGNQLSSPNNKWFQATNVFIGDNPSGHEVRYSNQCGLLQSGATAQVNIKGVGIRRFASYMTGFGVLYFTASNCTLENVVFNDIAATCVWTSGTASPWTTGITYRHVTARRVGFQFSGGGSSDAVVLDACDFQQINSRNFNPGGPSLAIIKHQASQGVTCKNSILSNSNCTGFWTDRTVGLPYIYGCRIENLGRHGIDIEGANNYLVANNLIRNTQGYSIWHNDSDQGDIWNNTLIDSNRGIQGGSPFCVAQSDRRATDPKYSWMKDTRQSAAFYDPVQHPEHQYVCNAFRLYNNVIVQNSGGLSQGIFSCQSQADTAPGANTRTFQPSFGPKMDGNVYWWSGTLQYPFICTKGGGVSPQIYFNLAAFKTATHLETNGTQVASTAPNPLNTSNWRLTDTTLHAKATALPTSIANLIGQPVGTKRAGAFLVG